jgi:hypothetical protein
MVGDGSRCFMGYNFYPLVDNGSTLTHSCYAVAGVLLSGVKFVLPFFIFTARAERMNMSSDKDRAGRRQAKKMLVDAEVIRILQEYNLMFDEMEKTLQEELIAIRLLRREEQGPGMVFETAVKLLERKSNRSVREDAVLAYAKKRLRELHKAG